MTDTSTRILAATCPEVFTDHEGAIGFDRIEHAGRIVSVVSEVKYRALRAQANGHVSRVSGAPVREVPENKAAPAASVQENTAGADRKGA